MPEVETTWPKNESSFFSEQTLLRKNFIPLSFSPLQQALQHGFESHLLKRHSVGIHNYFIQVTILQTARIWDIILLNALVVDAHPKDTLVNQKVPHE